MEQQFFELVKEKIFKFSGINISTPQEDTLKKFIERRAGEEKLSVQQFCDLLEPGNIFLDEVINLVTVNETYFFREQRQFDFLATQLFPAFSGKKINIWSGASSTGEEAISLLALANSCNVNATVYATDIDDTVIEHIKNGVYSGFSFREDGKKYHGLLEKYYSKNDRSYVFDKDFISRIKISKFNLISGEVFPFSEKMDLIFLRNVFIYFDKETRKKVCQKINSQLKEGGHLFFSMNEVGCLDTSIIPTQLHKVNFGEVYFFEKEFSSKRSYSSGDTKENSGDETVSFYKQASDSNEKGTSQKSQKVNPLLEKIAAQSAEKRAAKAAKNKRNPVFSTTQVSSSTNQENNSAPKNNTVVKPVRVMEPIINQNQNTDSSMMQIFQQIGEHINTNNFEIAKNLVSKINGLENKFYQYFFEGYVEYHADNKEKAERLFSSAELIKQNFWPAYFYHGLVLKDFGKDEKAKFCFRRCREILDEFKDSNPYNFVLDSFSPAYIYSLCGTLQGNA